MSPAQVFECGRTLLQGLLDERLQLQSLRVPWLVLQERADVLQGPLIVLQPGDGGERGTKSKRNFIDDI